MPSFLAITVLVAVAAAQGSSPCRFPGELTRIPELPEASGIAASRRTQGMFWAHNDSGQPVLFAIDRRGAVKARVRVTGATVDDWEDIAVAACGERSCLYIADIGDNNGERDHIRVYRTAEPGPEDGNTAPVDTLAASYPDGAHDAEALFVTADGGLYVLTKGDPGPVALYRFPRALTPGKRMRLEQVGAPMIASKEVDAKDRPTAADISPDGRWLAIRTTHALAFHRTADVIAGRWTPAARIDLSSLGEPRGEGLAFADANSLVLIGEGGGPTRAGTFAQVTCTLPD